MAASGEQTALEQLGQDATCPLCLDFFEQPMVLPCGHNFCRHCLAQLGATFSSCPLCRAPVASGSASPNQALANIACHLKRLRLPQGAQEESSGRRLCREHGEPLRSFCSSEKRLLCPGCMGGHQGHPVLSLPEAAQEYKDLLHGLLEPLRKEGQKLLEQREEEEKSQQEIQEKFAAEKEKVGLVMESLQEVLREGKSVWMAHLTEEQGKMEAEQGVTLAQLSGEASRLQQLIAQTERKCRQPDEEFLQEIQDTVERCRSYLVGRVERDPPRLPERQSAILRKAASVRQILDQEKASLETTLSRENLERPLAAEPAPRYDVSTAHPRLQCNRSTVFWNQKYQECLETPERFNRELCVLGHERFTTGRKWWEVSIGGKVHDPVEGRACWAIGVAKDSVRRKGSFKLSPKEGIWALGKYKLDGEIVAFSEVPQEVIFGRPLWNLRVRLGYEAETVEFLDDDAEISLFTFQTGPFLGETLRPFFYVGHNGVILSVVRGI